MRSHHALAGELWEEALTYARQAGGKALELSAYREARIFAIGGGTEEILDDLAARQLGFY